MDRFKKSSVLTDHQAFAVGDQIREAVYSGTIRSYSLTELGHMVANLIAEVATTPGTGRATSPPKTAR
jgi:hypothetical protein